MIELVVVITIVGVMAVLAATLIKPQQQLAKARDTQRKSDLKVIAHALEGYADDKVCYPEESVINVCQGSSLKPYLPRIPCDPLTGQAYHYIRFANCKQYVIYANLELDTGFDYGVYNYAVSSGNVITIPPI